MTPRGRSTRALALVLLLALVAVLGLAAGRWREIAGRFWLARAEAVREPSGAIVRVAEVLGPNDPRLAALLRWDAGELALTVATPTAAAAPGRIPALRVEVENRSSRTIVLFTPLVAAALVEWPGASVTPIPAAWWPTPAGQALGPGERASFTTAPVSYALLPGDAAAPGPDVAAITVVLTLSLGNRSLVDGPVHFERDVFVVDAGFSLDVVAWARTRLPIAHEKAP